MSDTIATIRKTAVASATAAGKIQKEHYGSILNVDHKFRNDVKLEVDRLCENAIIATIKASHPNHSILAEESGADKGNGEFLWVIDPLDGTVNFFYGLPLFCTSVACYKTTTGCDFPLGEPVAGAVYAPALDEMFVAAAGEGATLNGKPIHASNVTELAESLVTTGYGSSGLEIESMRKIESNLAQSVRKVRILGAAALDMCNVACGRSTGFYERGIKSWDIAAGYLIIKEAGGKIIADNYETDTWEIIAGGSEMFDALLEKVRTQ